jgi:hypothetical protein
VSHRCKTDWYRLNALKLSSATLACARPSKLHVRSGWIGKSPGHNATPRMLRDRNRSREKRLYGPDGRPSAGVLIFRKRSGTISESARLVCGTDGGPLP